MRASARRWTIRATRSTYNGTTWSAATSVDPGGSLKSVSCTTAYDQSTQGSEPFCAAVDGSGNALSYANGTWTTTNVDSSNAFRAVSCAGATFCVAVDTSGHELSFNGMSWSAPVLIDTAGHTITSVSCASFASCQAVDGVGFEMSSNGSTWRPRTDIDGAKTITSVSCAAPGSCVAVDGSGNALTYSAPLSTGQFTWDTNSPLTVVLSDGANDYIYGPNGTPVEQVSLATSTPTYLAYNASDSRWVATNGAGDETGFWGYDAFGTLAFGNPQSAFGYAGQYSDATTGLSNMRARWYEPETGGFTTRDPLFSQTDQAYAYAGDDPVNHNDPSGKSVIGCIVGGLLGCLITGGPSGGTIPKLIVSVSWGPPYAPGGPCKGLTLTVHPSLLGTVSVISPVSNLLTDQAWDQTLKLANQAPKPTEAAVANTPSMYDQFVCHWELVRIRAPGRAFHLNTWFPPASAITEAENQCNYNHS